MSRVYTRREAVDRVLDRVDVGDCWLFTGNGTRPGQKGYGLVHNPGGTVLTHRIVWEALVGEIPKGMQLDHLCQMKACVNPNHLRVVTPSENVQACKGHRSATEARQTHCYRGHPLSGDNLYINTVNETRQCKKCQRIARLARTEKAGVS